MKKGGLDIHIHLSNRWLYTFIAIGILVIMGVGVYAAVDTTKAWHPANQIDFSGAGNGLYWPKDMGGGAGDEAWINYSSITGENMRLQIGVSNDAEDYISFYQGGSEKMNISGGNVYVAGQIGIAGGSPAAGKVLTSDANGLATWTTPSTGITTELDPKIGTITNAKWCVGDTTGKVQCTTDAPSAGTTLPICADGKILKKVSGAWACADDAGITTETDPKFPTCSSGQFLKFDGTNWACTAKPALTCYDRTNSRTNNGCDSLCNSNGEQCVGVYGYQNGYYVAPCSYSSPTSTFTCRCCKVA